MYNYKFALNYIFMVSLVYSCLLTLPNISLGNDQDPDSPRTTIHVPGDYPTIQAAINASSSGDTILVDPGTYIENLFIDKDITIESTGEPSETIIDGNGASEVIFINGIGCTVDGFSIINGGVGILVFDFYYSVNISTCNIHSNSYGIYCGDTFGSAITIDDCYIWNNTDFGIYYGSAFYSSDFRISYCNIFDNVGPGIQLFGNASDVNITIDNNIIYNNIGPAISFSDMHPAYFLGSIKGNTIDTNANGIEILPMGGSCQMAIFKNNIIDNTCWDYDGGSTWYRGYQGNYWSVHPQGDNNGYTYYTPYEIPGHSNQQDLHPLVYKSIPGAIDNKEHDFIILNGYWNEMELEGSPYGSTYGGIRYTKAGHGSNRVAWKVNTETIDEGRYNVFVRKFDHPHSHRMAANAQFKVKDANGLSKVTVDQSTQGDTWVHIGEYEFTNDNAQGVALSDKANGLIISDAICLMSAHATDLFFRKNYGVFPSDGETDVSRLCRFYWDFFGSGPRLIPGPFVTITYDVYVGKEKDSLKHLGSTTQNHMSIDPDKPLNSNTTYYWRVDYSHVSRFFGIDMTLTSIGNIHSFTTTDNDQDADGWDDDVEAVIEDGIDYLNGENSDGEFPIYESENLDMSNPTKIDTDFASAFVHHSLGFLENLPLTVTSKDYITDMKTTAITFINSHKEDDDYDDPEIDGQDINGSIWRYYYGVLPDPYAPWCQPDTDDTCNNLKALYDSGINIDDDFADTDSGTAAQYFIDYYMISSNPEQQNIPDYEAFDTWIQDEDGIIPIPDIHRRSPVVNANILYFYCTQLTSTELQSKIPDVIDFLNYTSDEMYKNRDDTVYFELPLWGGNTEIGYLSPFSYTYAVSRAYRDVGAPVTGTPCLNLETIVDYILWDKDGNGFPERQASDGSWGNFQMVNNVKTLVTNDFETVLATLSLINMYNKMGTNNKAKARTAIELSITNLLANQNGSGGWDLEMWYLGPPVVGGPLTFHGCPSACTVLALEALVKYYLYVKWKP